MTTEKTSAFSVIGVGTAACIACCAPLLLGFLGSLGIAGLASTLLIGVGGLAIAAVATAALVIVRNRRTSCATPDKAVPVATPQRRKITEATGPAQAQLLP